MMNKDKLLLTMYTLHKHLNLGLPKEDSDELERQAKAVIEKIHQQKGIN